VTDVERSHVSHLIFKGAQCTSSNKPKIPLKYGPTSGVQGGTQAKGPNPFIDRLTVTLKVSSPEDSQDIQAAHFGATTDQSVFKQAKPSKGYCRAYRIALPSVIDHAKWPFYEYAWGDQGITRIRLEFIPVDLGAAGLLDLHAVLVTLMPDGWGNFIRYGRITRIDIASDLPNAEMKDFYPLPAGGVRCVIRDCKGHLQTIELGVPKGSQTVIYDRKAKRIAKSKSWHGKEGVRIERRLRLPNLMLEDLPDLVNPFTQLTLIARYVPQPHFEKNRGKWLRFICAVHGMGLAPALATVPEARRKKYREHLKSCAMDTWNHDTLFQNWKAYQLQSRIADLTALN